MEVGVLKLDEEVVVVRLDWTRITMGMIWKQIIRLIPLRYVVPGSTSKMHKCKVWLMGKWCSALMFSLALGSPDDSQIHCSSSTSYKASYANNKEKNTDIIADDIWLITLMVIALFRQSDDTWKANYIIADLFTMLTWKLAIHWRLDHCLSCWLMEMAQERSVSLAVSWRRSGWWLCIYFMFESGPSTHCRTTEKAVMW